MVEACILIDIRPVSQRQQEGAVPNSHSFPAAELAPNALAFAMPPRSRQLVVIYDEGNAADLEMAMASLRRLGFRNVVQTPFHTFANVSKVDHMTVSRCWEPCPFLQQVMPHVEESAAGRVCVDVGCGCGRDMSYVAMRGWAVVGVDCRRKLIGQALCLAQRHGCAPHVGVVVAELSTAIAFRPTCADLVVAVRFLHRPTLPLLLGLVAAGGFLVYSHFLDGCQHTATGTPSTVEGFFLVGELEAFCTGSGLDVLISETCIIDDGRPVVNVLCRRPVLHESR